VVDVAGGEVDESAELATYLGHRGAPSGQGQRGPEKLGELSPVANAVRAGYLIAQRAYYKVSLAGEVICSAKSGKKATLTGRALARLEDEYKYGAGRIG
jgi:hypothetical protein